MKKPLTTKISNNRIVSLLITLALGVLMMSGCSQVNNLVNGNATTNTNQANTNTANSNTNTAQPSKNSLVGTWIDVDDPTKKITFTETEFTTTIKNDEVEKGTYKIIGEQEIASTNSAGRIEKGRFTLDGDLLTISTGDFSVKLKRETATAATETAEEKIKKQIIGTWVQQQGTNTIVRGDDDLPVVENGRRKFEIKWVNQTRFIFSSEGLVQIMIFNGGNSSFILNWIGPYRLKDEKTLEIFQGAGQMPFDREYKIQLDESGKLVFENSEYSINRIVRESNNSNFLLSAKKFYDSDVNNSEAAGWWGADDEKVVIFHDYFCRINADGTFNQDRLARRDDQNVNVLIESGEKVSSDWTTLQIVDKNGVGKAYKRLTDWTENYPCY